MSIGRYFYLKQELEFTNFRLSLELRDINKSKPNEYLKYKSIYEEQNSELNLLDTKFSECSITAEGLRHQMIQMLHGCLIKVNNILQRGFYPSLDQGMVLRGYIFGKIRQALKDTMTHEGSYNLVPQMYMSHERWDYNILLEALSDAKELLEKTKFYSIKDALEWHDKIQNHILLKHKMAIGYTN